MSTRLFCLCALSVLSLSASAQEVPNHPDVWKSAGTRTATPGQIQALIAVPGPGVDRNAPLCRALPPVWGKGTPADEAAAQLVEIGTPAIESLLPLLDSKEVWQRRLTAEILGRIGDRSVVPALLTHLPSEADESVRISTFATLSMLRDVRAEDALIAALHDKNYRVMANATQGLGRLKTRRAIATLIALLKPPVELTALGFNNPQGIADTASAGLRESGSQAFPSLLQILKRPAVPAEVLVFAIPPAAAAGDKRVVPVLLRLLKHPADAVRASAAANVMPWKDPRTVPALAQVLNGPRGSAPGVAGRLLAADGSPKSLEILGKAAMSPQEDVRIAVAGTFNALTTRAAVPLLVKVVQAGESGLAPAAAVALGNLEDPAAIPALIAALTSSDIPLRTEATSALGRFDTPEVVGALLTRFTDTDPTVRLQALRVLRKWHDPRILPALQPLTTDPDGTVQMQAIQSIRVLQSRLSAAR